MSLGPKQFLGLALWLTSTSLNEIFRYISVKFLEILKPFISVLPEVSKPERKVGIISNFYGYMFVFLVLFILYMPVIICMSVIILWFVKGSSRLESLPCGASFSTMHCTLKAKEFWMVDIFSHFIPYIQCILNFYFQIF